MKVIKALMGIKNFLWKYRYYLIVLALTIPAVAPLLKPGYFSMHDDLQILRLQQLDKCFQDGQFPCRWVPDPGFGYGYPMFNYYPPLPYYLAQVFYTLGIDIFWSIKIVFILSFVLSGLFMMLLVGSLLGPLAGVVAAAFYVWAPYHSVDVYVRGAMNEAWGLTFFPLILYFAYRLARGDAGRLLKAGLAVSFAALLTSHNVMTLIFSPILAVWTLMWLWYFKTWKQIKPLIIGGLWGIGLAAFFFLPVTVEKELVHVETMTIGYFNYLAHFADFKQLFFSRFWGYGGSTWGPEDDMAFPVGHFQWITALVALLISLVLLFKAWKKHGRNLRAWGSELYWVWFFVPVGFFYTFLTHSRAVWFWDHLPLLYYAQFPWRLLAIPALTFSIIAGVLVYWLNKKKIAWVVAVALIAGVMVWNYPFFKIQRQVTTTYEEKLSGNLWELQVTGGIFDYLPKTASRPPGGPAFIYPLFIQGNGGVMDFKRGTSWMTFTANVSTPDALLQLPQYEYPRTVITLDGKRIEFGHDWDIGRLEIEVPEGKHEVEVRLQDTPIRTFSNLISLVAVAYLVRELINYKKRK